MEYIRKTYIKMLNLRLAGGDGESVETVETRDIERLKNYLNVKAAFCNMIAFSFFDVIVAEVKIDDEPIELRSLPLNGSPLYYYGYNCALHGNAIKPIWGDLRPFNPEHEIFIEVTRSSISS